MDVKLIWTKKKWNCKWNSSNLFLLKKYFYFKTTSP
jgi:hypothetical protein